MLLKKLFELYDSSVSQDIDIENTLDLWSSVGYRYILHSSRFPLFAPYLKGSIGVFPMGHNKFGRDRYVLKLGLVMLPL